MNVPADAVDVAVNVRVEIADPPADGVTVVGLSVAVTPVGDDPAQERVSDVGELNWFVDEIDMLVVAVDP